MYKKKKVAGAFLGTIVEYYDCSLYGFSASILAEKFFPNAEIKMGLMYVFGIYASSYFAKPLGSLVFGHIGDLYGRILALRITMIGIAIPTCIIGLLPEYESIGWISILILIVCKFLQGFFVSGEYDGAAIYVMEHLGKKYHYTASAITRATGVLGLLLGIASTSFFNSSIFPEWCWRIPFLLAAPLGIVTIYYRKFLEETPDFLESNKENIQPDRLVSFIKKRWISIFMVILLSGGFGATYQISIIFMKSYLPIVVPDSQGVMTSFSVLIVLVFGLMMPISGILADKFGKSLVIKISFILSLLSSFLLSAAIHYQLVNLALVSSILLAMSVAPFNCLAHGVMVSAFKTKEKYRGVSLGHTTGSMIMSGTAAYVCLFFINRFDFKLFPLFYVAFFAAMAYFAVKLFDNKQK